MAGEGGSATAAGLLNGGAGEGPGGKRARLGSAPHAPPAGNRVTVVLGAQWGDEGKGKVVDLLSLDADLVCRCQVSPRLCSGAGGLQAPSPPRLEGTTNPTLRRLADLSSILCSWGPTPILISWENYKTHPLQIGGTTKPTLRRLGELLNAPSADWEDYKSHPPQIGGLKPHPLQLGELQIPPSVDRENYKFHPPQIGGLKSCPSKLGTSSPVPPPHSWGELQIPSSVDWRNYRPHPV